MRLGDMNDHSPVFDKEEYHVNIPESALVNTPITKLKVSKVSKVPNCDKVDTEQCSSSYPAHVIYLCLSGHSTHACVRDSNMTPELT